MTVETLGRVAAPLAGLALEVPALPWRPPWLLDRPWALWLLLLLPALWLLSWRAARRARRATLRFGDPLALRSATTVHRGRRRLRGLALGAALVLLVLGAAGPRWGREADPQTRTGRDIVVALDVSRSMLAEQPSRLERARRLVADLCAALERSGGHRLGLVAFASRAAVLCPLTHDYEHVRWVCEQVSAARLPPALQPDPATATSGTRIGAALALAAGLHDSRFRGSQDVLMISDGDDPVTDGEWLDGVAEARRAGIAVDVVGVGEGGEPSPIPAEGGPLVFDGQEVRSRLREDLLKDVARRTGGVYIPAGTRSLPLGALYMEVLDQREERRAANPDRLPTYRQRYGWFLWPALALLLVATLTGDGTRTHHKDTKDTKVTQRKTG